MQDARPFWPLPKTAAYPRRLRSSNTPSGVSQLINALEADLGFALLHRSRKGVSLTPAGKQMLPVIRSFVQQEKSIYENAAEVMGLAIGEFTIASYSSIATHWLPKVIAGFQKIYPNIHIDLMEGVRQEVVAWLEDDSADLAFLSYMDDIEAEWIPLAEDRMMAVLPLDHPYADAESYPLSECEKENFIMPALGRDEDVLQMFERNGIVPNIVHSTMEPGSTYAMVENGLGINVSNELILQGWTFKVAKVPIEPPQSITLGIALPSKEHASPAVRRFVKYAVKELRK